MSKSVRVLYVDADAEFADLAAARLERDGGLVVETATTAERGLERHADGRVDCIVTEYDLPETDGVEFLERIRHEAPNLPVVLFTDDGSETVASAAIAAGVTGYVRKSEEDALGRLADRIETVADRDDVESSAPSHRRRLLEEHDVLDRMTDVFTALDTDWRITYLNEGGRRAIASNLDSDSS